LDAHYYKLMSKLNAEITRLMPKPGMQAPDLERLKIEELIRSTEGNNQSLVKHLLFCVAVFSSSPVVYHVST